MGKSISKNFNINDRKQADEALREQAFWNEQFLNTTMDGYILADNNGKLFDVNPAHCKLLDILRKNY